MYIHRLCRNMMEDEKFNQIMKMLKIMMEQIEELKKKIDKIK